MADTVKVDIVHSRDKYPAGSTYPIIFRIHIPSGLYIHGAQNNDDGIIPTSFSFEDSPFVNIEQIRFPLPEKKRFDYTNKEIDLYSGEVPVRAGLKVMENAHQGKQLIKGILSYQACSSTSCFPPEDVDIPVRILIVPAHEMAEQRNQMVFESPDGTGVIPGQVKGWNPGAGFWLTLTGIFFGGLALNLTPCIYPLIPITDRLSLTKTDCPYPDLRGSGFSCFEFLRPLGFKTAGRVDPCGIKKLWRLFRDIFYGSDPGDRCRPMSRAVYVGVVDLCRAERRPFFGISLFLCPKYRHGASSFADGNIFRSRQQAASLRRMDGMDKKDPRMGSCGYGRLFIKAPDTGAAPSIRSYGLYPAGRRFTPRMVRKDMAIILIYQKRQRS